MTHVEPSPQRRRPPQDGSFANAWTLFRVRGVPVRVDKSWLFIAALVAFFFFRNFQVTLPGAGAPSLVVLAAAGAVLFFASILAHELGHAMTSLDRGIPVMAITLFALGGVTESTREARRARDEFVIVGIGPFISLVLAAAFGLVFTAVSDVRPLAALAGYLAWTNLMLAAFNVVPGYPLDGGRLLRSVLWGATGQPHKATRWAARVGQVFAGLLIAFGLAAFLTGGVYGITGIVGWLIGFVSTPWSAVIGFFLLRGATDSHRRAKLRERLDRRTVREVMGSVPPALSPSMALSEAIEHVQQRPSLLWPVGDPVDGVLLLDDIDAVAADSWSTTTVADVARSPQGATASVDDSLGDAFALMSEAPRNMVIVTDQGRPIGLLTPSLVSELAR